MRTKSAHLVGLLHRASTVHTQPAVVRPERALPEQVNFVVLEEGEGDKIVHSGEEFLVERLYCLIRAVCGLYGTGGLV